MLERTTIIIPLDNHETIMDDTPAESVWKEYCTDQVGIVTYIVIYAILSCMISDQRRIMALPCI